MKKLINNTCETEQLSSTTVVRINHSLYILEVYYYYYTTTTNKKKFLLKE